MNKKVNFILASATCSEAEFDKIHLNDESKTSQSAGKYFRTLCEGIARNGNSMRTYTVRPTSKLDCGKNILPAKDEIVNGVAYHYSKDIFVKGIKRVHSMISAFFWFMNPKHCSKNTIVIVDPLNISLCIGVEIACKLRGIKILADITDVPVCYAFGSENKWSLWEQLALKLGQAADMFIFLTKQMDDIMNPKKRPYIVIEGFSDIKMLEKNISLSDKYQYPVIMYTGAIEKKYGLDSLVEGFLKANILNSELHLYGAGSYVEEIKEISKKHPNVKYMGCRSNSVIVEEQMKATLLVNPRYTNEEYTKYSFPGKNLEYMASGTPVLTTDLPGMPKDHKDYLYLLKEENVQGVSDALKTILTKDIKDLYEFGNRAKEFVMQEKNNVVQAKKIIEFVDGLK